MDRSPPTYEPAYELRTDSQSSVVNLAFAKSPSGIIKSCEIVLSVIVFICVAATESSYHSSWGWVNFVAAFTIIFSALFYIFYFFNIIRRLRGPWVIIEFCVLVVSTFIWFVAFCVAVSQHSYGGGAIAAAIFSLFAMAVYIVELVIRFRVSRQTHGFRITMTGVTTTTTSVPPNTYPQLTTPSGTSMMHDQQQQPGDRMGFEGSYGGPTNHPGGDVMM